MDDYALVLNAGSSSLKFCVYRRPATEVWRLEAQGQIEGIGTSPRLSAKDGQGSKIADDTLVTSVRDGRGATAALAGWLRAHYGGSRVLAVGHRVVHGGTRFAAPAVVTPTVLDELRQLVPLAVARRAAGRLLRYELPPRRAGGRRGRAAARAHPRVGRQALRISRPLV
jgi:acetate kinase